MNEGSASIPARRERPRPEWLEAVYGAYRSGTAAQFILHGNVRDLFPLTGSEEAGGVDLDRFLEASLGAFRVLITADIGQGIQLVRGEEHLRTFGELGALRGPARSARDLCERLNRLFLFLHNASIQTGQTAPALACILRDAHLLLPADGGGLNFDLNAAASLVRDWSRPRYRFTLVSFLLVENLAQLHPVVAGNPFALSAAVALPGREEIAADLREGLTRFPAALQRYTPADVPALAEGLAGLTRHALFSLLRQQETEGRGLTAEDIGRLRRSLVERESRGLLSFLKSSLTLEHFNTVNRYLVESLRQDMRLLRAGETRAVPMGYLFCGPVGTGKTFLAECLAGEAGVPAVELRNFRDRWVGSSEANLETILRQVEALGRCLVFVDEADQALGKRTADPSNEVSGRLYATLAKFMARPSNRGKIVWIFATSRPDQLEVDLKRPGRIDVKVPLFPTLSAEEGYALIRAIFTRQELALPARLPKDLPVPDLLTPGAVTALAANCVKHRLLRPRLSALAHLRDLLENYLPPVPRARMLEQIQYALDEVTDPAFVPAELKALLASSDR